MKSYMLYHNDNTQHPQQYCSYVCIKLLQTRFSKRRYKMLQTRFSNQCIILPHIIKQLYRQDTYLDQQSVLYMQRYDADQSGAGWRMSIWMI